MTNWVRNTVRDDMDFAAWSLVERLVHQPLRAKTLIYFELLTEAEGATPPKLNLIRHFRNDAWNVTS